MSPDALENPKHLSNGLFWLLRLRWIAAGGIVLLSGFSGVWFGLRLPWSLLLGIAAAVVFTNLLVIALRPLRKEQIRRWTLGLILGDIVLLTLALYYTGGAHNPFTVLFVLHTTLAVMLLDWRWAWFVVGLCGGCFALLFSSHHMMIGPEGTSVCDDLDFHLQGMFAATVITGGGVVYFVTHLNRSLEAMRVTTAQAREIAEKERRFASLVTVAAGVSHELATPLGTIAVASRELELSGEEGEISAPAMEDVLLIRREVERCRKILGRMGEELNRPDAGADRFLALGELRATLEASLPEEQFSRIFWEIQAPDERIPMSDGALLQVVSILVKNACEAVPDGSPIQILARTEKETLELVIKDTGVGMSPETLERFGEPFFTSKPQGQGTGLGVFLAKALVEKSGGRLLATSVLKKGTEILLSLPRTPRP